ncbi:MAG: hypothetical protein WCP17_02750 [bacterium]
MKKQVPTNTTTETLADPSGLIAEAMIFGAGASIERQEARGQRSFVESTTLPTEIRGGVDCNPEAALEAMGVKFLGVVEGDELFQNVELPKGWKKVADGHSMHSHLVDDKGRTRASIFYKAAFYDRRADMSLHSRYSVMFDYNRAGEEHIGVTNVIDNVVDHDKVIYTTEPIAEVTNANEYQVSKVATKLAIEWLDKNYPDWRSPAAYWD